MIAGSLGFLSEPLDDPIESTFDRGVRGIDADLSMGYLDGRSVQKGLIAGSVPTENENIYIGDSSIDVETVEGSTTAVAEWVADVQNDGWILADRTHSTEEEHLPEWPFAQFQRELGVEIQPMGIDVHAFVKRQREAGRDFSVEMSSIEGSDSDNVEINWGKRVGKDDALQANVGTALTVNWEGSFQRLVIYESGYTAIWSADDLTPKVGRFVTEEIVPVAIPLAEVEAEDDGRDNEDLTQMEVSD